MIFEKSKEGSAVQYTINLDGRLMNMIFKV